MAQHTDSSQTEAADPQLLDATQAANLVLVPSISDPESAYGPPAERRRSENRRQGAVRAFVYGNFRPRRRNHRRAADEHRFLFDWHEPRILYLALCILLLSCTDALFTLNLLNAGASEANPAMASMLEHGVEAFVISKISLTSISLIILVVVARRKFFRSFNVEHLLKVFCLGYTLVIYYEIYLFTYVFQLDII